MRRAGMLLGLMLVLGLPAGSGRTAPAGPTKWALMIGVNQYPKLDEQFQLRGCENDVKLMSGLLTAKFGFDPARIKLLNSREATKEGIEKAFRTWLIDQARAGDMVLFHFSGHGSQVEDKNNDEEDGLDETLCPSDIDPEKADRQIIDDTIAEWIKQLQAKGVRDITFVLDCCHSGTATKSVLLDTGFSRSRYVDPMVLYGHPLVPRDFAVRANQTPPQQEAPDDVVVISGCMDSQQSNDAAFGGAFNGALSYFLTASLQNAAESVTYEELMREVRRRVQEKFPTQTPQFQGPGPRRVFAARQAAPTRPFVVVTQANGAEVQIAAGANAGVTPGSLYQVYRADDRTLTGAGVGQIEITSVQPNEARARATRGAGRIQAGCRAVEEAHFYPPDKLYVRVDAVAGAPTTEFTRAIQALDYVATPEGERVPDRVVKVSRAAGQLQAQIVTTDGLPGRTFTAADGAALAGQVKPELENAFTIKLLARLENPNPSFKVRVRIEREENPVYYFDRDRVQFSVQADRDCYITVLDVGTSGRIAVLFPNRFHPENRILANQVYQVPDPNLPPEQRFQITVRAPVGREMVKVIATEKPLNLTGLDFQGMQGVFKGVPDSLNFARNLSVQVRDFVVRQKPQQPAPTPTAGWATDFVTLQIRDPQEIASAGR